MKPENQPTNQETQHTTETVNNPVEISEKSETNTEVNQKKDPQNNQNEVKEISTEKPATKPLPFNVKNSTRDRYQKIIGKATDENLNRLLDVFENSQKQKPENAVTDMSDKKLTEENSKLKKQLELLKDKAEKNITRIAELENTISELKKTQHKKPEASETANDDKIKALQDELSEKDKLLHSLENKLRENPEAQTLKDRNGALEEQQRQDKKLIDAYRENKKSQENTITKLENQIKDLEQHITGLQDRLKDSRFAGYSGDDDFLTSFPDITARLLQLTAEKLTESRRDNLTVTPSVILGDMFLKYTIQKRTMWFYKWVLTDAEILSIAKEINPNITSIRILKRVLNIDNELN